MKTAAISRTPRPLPLFTAHALSVLREHGQTSRRDRTRRPCRPRPRAVYATAPNQVWMWDITYARGRVNGLFFYLYLFIDLYDRSVVGWGLYREESAEHAALLIRSICMDHGRLSTQPLVLHSDNGAVMKSALMLGALQDLGITASFSRPRVSNDNPYSESLFRTLKTRHDYPAQGFDCEEQARSYIAAAVSWINPQHRPGTSAVSPPCSGAGVRIACS